MARRVEVQLVGDSRSLERAFDRAGRKGQQFDSRMSGASASLKGFAKAGVIGAAVGGAALITSQLFKSVQAAKDSQVANTKLRQALGASGKSYKRYGKEIDAAIQKTSKLAGIDDEELSDSFSNLVRTTGSVTEATKGMALAADIARARNISLDSATKIVERTLNGQYLSLKRVGVQVDKNMTSTEALEAAHKKFAGSAEAYGKTAAGAQEKLAVAWENAQEKIGQKLLPILTKLSLKLVDLIEWAEVNWPRFSRAVSNAWEKIRPVFEAFKNYFMGWVKLIDGIIHGEWGKAWAGLKQVVAGAFKLLYEYLKLVPAKLFAWGVKMGEQLAKGVLAGLGDLAANIGNKLLPGNPFGGGSDKEAAPRTRKPANPAPSGLDTLPRARGGPVAGGRSYLVGERGPEILTMGSRSGRITPGGAGGLSIGVVHVHGVQNVREFLGELQRISKQSGSQSRGQYGGQSLALN